MTKKTVAFILAVFTFVSVFSSCSKTPAEKAGYILDNNEKIYPDDFLVIGGIPVSFQEFRYYYLNYRDMYKEENGEDYFSDESKEIELKNEIINCIKDSISVKKLAEEYNVELSKDEKSSVYKDIESTVEFYGGDEGFSETISESYMTRSLYEDMAMFSSLFLKTFDAVFSDNSKYAWDDEKFFEYYRENYIGIQAILIKYKSGEDINNSPETKKVIDEITEKINQGSDFWSLVEEYGEDTEMEMHPKGYYFTKGQAEDVLYDNSVNLEENAVSGPVYASDGIYILKRVPLENEEMKKYKDTALKGYTDSQGEFHSGKYDSVFEEIYTEKSNSLEVVYPEIWDKINTKTVF